jgi:hypothetical protein
VYRLPPRPSCTAIETSVCEPDLLSSRKNIYDNDEFDIFAHGTLDKSRVHMGKKKTGDAAQLLDDKTFIQQHKAALLERIYSYDEYDDEYDDTYDGLGETPVLDAVTTEDATDAISDPTAPFEAELVQRWMSNPSLFERTSRRSKDREQLRKLTGLTDEQIEGWAIQLQRNVSIDHGIHILITNTLLSSHVKIKYWRSMNGVVSNKKLSLHHRMHLVVVGAVVVKRINSNPKTLLELVHLKIVTKQPAVITIVNEVMLVKCAVHYPPMILPSKPTHT